MALAGVLAAILEAQSPQELAAASQREAILRQQQSLEWQIRAASPSRGELPITAPGVESPSASVAAQRSSIERQREALSRHRHAVIPFSNSPAVKTADPGQRESAPNAGSPLESGVTTPPGDSIAAQLEAIALQPRPSWPAPPEPAGELACAPLPPALLGPIFDRAASAFSLESSLLHAVARKESAFQPCAVSPAGAMGLMQLMPETAATLGVSDPFDAEQNIFAGARFLRFLLERFENNLSLALSAYNAGPSRVERHGGIPPIPETQDYVASILRSLGKLPPR